MAYKSRFWEQSVCRFLCHRLPGSLHTPYWVAATNVPQLTPYVLTPTLKPLNSIPIFILPWNPLRCVRVYGFQLRSIKVIFICLRVVVSYRDHNLNALPAKLFNLNFHPPEVVSRWRDPQLQVSENYSDLAKWRSTVFKYFRLMSHFSFVTCLKGVFNVLIKKEKPNICDTGG